MAKFDIRDGKNRYMPCMNCGARYGMGLVTRGGKLAVQCGTCGNRGPDVSGPIGSDQDKSALGAWNGMTRKEEG
jgi:hypothetical protein